MGGTQADFVDDLVLTNIVSWEHHEAYKPPRYLCVYEEVLGSMPIRVLVELGSGSGRSLNLFASRFPTARIVGIDLKKPEVPLKGNVEFIKADVASLTEEQLDRIGDRVDVVIDDASHLVGDVVSAFRRLFPRLASGGVYAIEDFGSFVNAPSMFEEGASSFTDNCVGLVKSFVSELAVWKRHRSRKTHETRISKMLLLPDLCLIWKR